MFLGKKVSISAYAFLAYVTDGMAVIKVGDQETHHTDEWASLFLFQGHYQVWMVISMSFLKIPTS